MPKKRYSRQYAVSPQAFRRDAREKANQLLVKQTALVNASIDAANTKVEMLIEVVAEHVSFQQAVSDLAVFQPTVEVTAQHAYRLYHDALRVLSKINELYGDTGGADASYIEVEKLYSDIREALKAAYTPASRNKAGDGGAAIRKLMTSRGISDATRAMIDQLTARGRTGVFKPGAEYIVRQFRQQKDMFPHRSLQVIYNHMKHELEQKEKAQVLNEDEAAALVQLESWGNPRTALSKLVDRHEYDFMD